MSILDLISIDPSQSLQNHGITAGHGGKDKSLRLLPISKNMLQKMFDSQSQNQTATMRFLALEFGVSDKTLTSLEVSKNGTKIFLAGNQGNANNQIALIRARQSKPLVERKKHASKSDDVLTDLPKPVELDSCNFDKNGVYPYVNDAITSIYYLAKQNVENFVEVLIDNPVAVGGKLMPIDFLPAGLLVENVDVDEVKAELKNPSEKDVKEAIANSKNAALAKAESVKSSTDAQSIYRACMMMHKAFDELELVEIAKTMSGKFAVDKATTPPEKNSPPAGKKEVNVKP